MQNRIHGILRKLVLVRRFFIKYGNTPNLSAEFLRCRAVKSTRPHSSFFLQVVIQVLFMSENAFSLLTLLKSAICYTSWTLFTIKLVVYFKYNSHDKNAWSNKNMEYLVIFFFKLRSSFAFRIFFWKRGGVKLLQVFIIPRLGLSLCIFSLMPIFVRRKEFY